ncbi:hypothetical protein ACHAWF_002616 [Thalassiosira exigua]
MASRRRGVSPFVSAWRRRPAPTYRQSSTATGDGPDPDEDDGGGRRRSAGPSNPPPAISVPPPPSWSVRDLRLAPSSDDRISEEELATLARRCLIDVRRLSSERRDRLRVHVAGIVRCASVLLDAKDLSVGEGKDGEVDLTDEEIYDAPRGLGSAPLRSAEDGDDWSTRDAAEARAVMRSEGVRSKTVTSEDGETLFSVITKR